MITSATACPREGGGHHHPVRRSRCPRRQDHRTLRTLHAAPPASGIYPLSQCRRSRGGGQQGGSVGLDNYATHKHPKVTAWLHRHRRFTFHFTPTSCSWANAVEGLFAKLTRQRLKRGVFTSIVDLQAAINRFIAEANGKPKPFVWIKSADAILAAVQRGRQALEAIH